MLDIILQILPILGIILLVLLCIIIIFLLLVLFVPVGYKISGKKDVEALSLSAGADWLFGLLRVRYAYPEPGRLTVKLLWFMLYDSGTVEHEEKTTGKEKTKDKNKNRAKEKTKDKTKNENKSRNKEKTEIISEKQSEDHSGIVSQTSVGSTESTGNIENTDNSPHKEQSQEASGNHEGKDEQGSNWISEKIKKIKFTICSTYDKIKKIWENISYYVLLLQEEETHLLFSHVMKRLGRVLRNIRPRRLRVNVLFGTGAPDTTGYAFGVYSMFSPVLGQGVVVTPDFERAVLEGDFDATGSVTSVILAWQFLRMILDKKLWRFMDKFKKGKEPVNTFGTETREENTKQGSGGRRKTSKK